MRNLIIASLILLFSLPVTAQEQAEVHSDWSKPTFVRLDATFSSTEFHARWDISRCECGDLHILAEETLPDEILKGEQLLIDSDVLLVRGYESYTGLLPALLDSPVLMMQLLFVLLQKTEASGPSAVAAVVQADIGDPNEAIMLDSGVAFGGFPAPWTATGTISPITGGQYRYELRFGFDLPGAPGQWIQLSGLLDYGERDFPADDSMVLDGWSAAWLDLKTENHEGLAPGLTLAEFKTNL
jgi:hypothetical protein